MNNENSKPSVSLQPPSFLSTKPNIKMIDKEIKQEKTNEDINKPNSNQVTNENGSTISNHKEAKENELIIYEFHFPVELCGRLIGRQGVHVDYIRQMAQVDLVVRDDAVSYEKQVVALHGRRVDVAQAIELIAKRFPPDRYPQVTFKPVNKKIIVRQRPPECVPIPSSLAQLYLPDGMPTEVLVTSVVSCNHIFVQQILHPSYSELARLDNAMSVFYHHTEMTPLLPRPIQPGIICAAPTQAGWFRALITFYNSNHDMAMIKFLDYGGYLYVHANSLRVLRQDFMVIPFQAVEVYLDNVVPADNQEDFTPESIESAKSMLLGSYFKAIVTGYHYDNTPFIQLTKRHGNARPINIDIQKMINNQHQTYVVTNNLNSISIHQLEQSDASVLSSTTNSDS